MSVAETIRAKLQTALAPSRIEIRDESHLHAGHAGAPAREGAQTKSRPSARGATLRGRPSPTGPGGESHFRILVVSPAFKGLSRVERQRRVNEALKDELAGPVHALAMTTLAPGEPGAEA